MCELDSTPKDDEHLALYVFLIGLLPLHIFALSQYCTFWGGRNQETWAEAISWSRLLIN